MDEKDIVVELGMTASQLQTLKHILVCWLRQYEENEGSVCKVDASAILEALEGVP